MKKIVEGVVALHGATLQKYKPKYKYLLKQFQKHGVMESDEHSICLGKEIEEPIEVAFILPRPMNIGNDFIEIGFEEVAGLMSVSSDPVYAALSDILLRWAQT